MLGVIQKRHLLFHPLITIRCFGWRIFAQALAAPAGKTFLGLLQDFRTFHREPNPVELLVARAAALERRAERIYASLADEFEHEPDAAAFFRSLSIQESSHAELLELCIEAAKGTHWNDPSSELWKSALEQLEARMAQFEAQAQSALPLIEALRLVISLETSEINTMFRNVVDANATSFVERFANFHRVGRRHLSFARHRIIKLAPELTRECIPLTRTREIGEQ